MKKLLLTTILSLTIATSASAMESIALPKGHTALNISATERLEVEQDMLVASLRIQIEDKDAKSVQKQINEAMADAVKLAKKNASLKIETGQYYVHPDYRYIKTREEDNKRVLDKWRGSQTITIKSEVADDLLNTVAKIQDMGFMMNNLNYQLSQRKHEETREGLMEKTVAKLRQRAKRVAKALGKEQVDIVEINVDSNNYNPQPVYHRAAKMEMMAMSADAGMPAPTAQAGETTVSMTISARAIIKP